MARITKKILQERLDASIRHQNLPFCPTTIWKDTDIREFPGFISAEKYPPWEVALKTEVGKTPIFRYIS